MANWFVNVFQFLSKGLKGAFRIAQERGLTDEIVGIALRFVRVAADRYVDNAAKREWVVKVLVARGIPESVARIAVELAVQVYKKERNNKVVWGD